MDVSPVTAAVEQAARDSYGRLLTFLAARSGDVAGAEDALGEAFVAALQHWSEDSIPANPEAWLLAAARRKWIDAVRRDQTRERFAPQLQHAMDSAFEATESSDGIPDERLKLLFVCAHPAIDPAARTPLMLQTVLGLSADRIASTFLSSPTAMGQRLVRAKAKIREAGIPFRVPPPEEWPERMSFVLDAVYAAYNAGWENAPEAGIGPPGLAGEAIWLARVLVRLIPDEPEALGLLALMLHGEARRSARLDGAESYVPLPEQDPARWRADLIAEAETTLFAAAALKRLGRFQIEAAIQSVHAQRALSGRIEWEAIALLYDLLISLTPALGARIGRAVAVCHARGPVAGLAMLNELPVERLQDHQPYWAAKAHLLSRVGQIDEARAAFTRALGLTENPGVRRYLRKQMDALTR